MSSEEAARWDHRYASGEYQARGEHSLVVERAADVIGSGRALVLACGAGRNAIYLASRGFTVDAVDISPVAIAMARDHAERQGVSVEWTVADLDDFDPGEGRYDLITMIRYTNRSIWPHIVPALTGDGWLVAEQHLRTRHPVAGPGPDYRLQPGELLGAFPDLRVIEYREEYGESPETGRMYATVTLIACKGDPGW